MSKTVRITGTMTFESEHSGEVVTRKVPPFHAPAETPWVDIVDEALERAEPAWGGAWVNTDENLKETPVNRTMG